MRPRFLKRRGLPALATTLALLALLAGTPAFGNGLLARPVASPQVRVRDTWQQARQAGAYRYSATLIQTTWPLPRLENVGLSSTQQRIYLEGAADLPAETLSMKLWAKGGSARTGQDALEIRVADGKTMGRVGFGDWQQVED